MRLMLKACVRCLGDIVYESDEFGDYSSCIQCGARDYLLAPLMKELEMTEGRRRGSKYDRHEYQFRD